MTTMNTTTRSRQPHLSEIVPARTDRACIFGQTGSGKTELARRLLWTRDYVVVLDTKGMMQWPEYEKHTSLASLTKSDAPRLLYAPNHLELYDAGIHDEF